MRLQHKTLNAVFNQGHIKVNQQAQAVAAQFQIGEELSLVDGESRFNGFQFHNHETDQNFV